MQLPLSALGGVMKRNSQQIDSKLRKLCSRVGEVEQRALGQSGLKVSPLGLGTATWGDTVQLDEAQALLAHFIDAGGNLVDTSPALHGGAAEQLLGKALRRGIPREDVLISTAAGVDPLRPVGLRVDCSRRGLLGQLERSLKALNVDHIDIWSVEYWDESTPVEEVADTLDHAISQGKVRYVGVRGYRGWQLALASTFLARGRRLVAAQEEYNLLRREPEDELIPAAGHVGVGFIAAAPLAYGALCGLENHGGRSPFMNYVGHKRDTIVDALITAGKGLQLSPAAVALSWVLGLNRNPAKVAATVVGARNLRQLDDALSAVRHPLPEQIIRALDEVSG